MKKLRIILESLAIALIANSYLLLRKHLSYLWIIIPAFLLINLFAGRSYVQTSTKRLKRCCHGGILLVIFQISTFCSAIHHLLWLPSVGLVSEKSFAWGERYTLLTPLKHRGISHGDMIDLNRENIDGFDVREFYVQLVSDLKARGL